MHTTKRISCGVWPMVALLRAHEVRRARVADTGWSESGGPSAFKVLSLSFQIETTFKSKPTQIAQGPTGAPPPRLVLSLCAQLARASQNTCDGIVLAPQWTRSVALSSASGSMTL